MPLGWGEGIGFFLSQVACHEWKEKIIPNESWKPIWIPHESQVTKPQVTSGESEWALSDKFGNYSCDYRNCKIYWK